MAAVEGGGLGFRKSFGALLECKPTKDELRKGFVMLSVAS